MSDIFELKVSYLVATPDGSLCVSDNNAGDAVLAQLAQQYPRATVIIKDRQSDEALSAELPIVALLQAKETFLMVQLTSVGASRKGVL